MPLRAPIAVPTGNIREFTKWCKEAIADGNVGTSDIEDNAVTYAKIQQAAALSVIGNATNATANVAGITAASDNTVLRRSGTAIAFGTLTSGMFGAAVIPSNALQADVAIISSGSYTGTLTGCTTAPTATLQYTKVGNIVFLQLASILNGTSNSIACTITGPAPAAIRPSTTPCRVAVWITDNSVNSIGTARMETDGTLTLGFGGTGGGFTAANTKGMLASGFAYHLL